MISFNCPNCGTQFEVEDELSGMRVACSECDTRFNVPTLNVSADVSLPPSTSVGEDSLSCADKLNICAELEEFTSSPTSVESPIADMRPPIEHQSEGAKLSPRQRRLTSDCRLMQERFSTFPLIHLERASGNPPETYVVSYHIKGIERVIGEQIIYRDYHEVEIKLPGTYPRTPPTCRMLTPVFHPNIEPAIICIGDHWTAAERLCDLVVRIGEMIAYQAYNIKSPLDGEAAMWADLHQSMLPIDGRDFTPPDL
jgi:predicted Zn finger-like uncharacterized protein